MYQIYSGGERSSHDSDKCVLEACGMYACACYFTAPKTCRSRSTENTLKIEDQDQTSKVLKRGEESPTKAADGTIECSKSSMNLSV